MFSPAIKNALVPANVLASSSVIRLGRDPWSDFLRIGNFSHETESLLSAQLQKRLPADRLPTDLAKEEIAEHVAHIDGELIPELRTALAIYQYYLVDPELSVAQAAAVQLRALEKREGMTLRQAIKSYYTEHAERVYQTSNSDSLLRLKSVLNSISEYTDDYDLMNVLVEGASHIIKFPHATMSAQYGMLGCTAAYPENLALGAAYCFQMVDRARFSNSVVLDRSQVEAEARDIAKQVAIPTFIDQSLNISSFKEAEVTHIEQALQLRAQIQEKMASLWSNMGDPDELTHTELRGLRMRSEPPEHYLARLKELNVALQSHVLSLAEEGDQELRARHMRRVRTLFAEGSRTQGFMVYGYPTGVGATFTPMFHSDTDEHPTQWAIVWSGDPDLNGVMEQLESQGYGFILYHGSSQLREEDIPRTKDFGREMVAEHIGVAFQEIDIEVIESQATGAISLRPQQYALADMMEIVTGLMSGDKDVLNQLDPELRQQVLERLPIDHNAPDDDATADNILPLQRSSTTDDDDNDPKDD